MVAPAAGFLLGRSVVAPGDLSRGEALVLAYCASKACVISMTQSMALALAPHKINVNGIAPGIVDTPFWVEVDKQFAKLFGWEVGEPKRKFVESIPLGRIEQRLPHKRHDPHQRRRIRRPAARALREADPPSCL